MGKHWMDKAKSYLAVYILIHHVTMCEDAWRLEILLKQETGHP